MLDPSDKGKYWETPSCLKNIKCPLMSQTRQHLLAVRVVGIRRTSSAVHHGLNPQWVLCSLWFTLPPCLPFFIHSVTQALPLCTEAKFLSTLTLLTALLLCALGAPVETEVTDILAGDSSGEEEDVVTHGLLSASPFWGLILGATARHQKEVSNFRQTWRFWRLGDIWFRLTWSIEAAVKLIINVLMFCSLKRNSRVKWHITIWTTTDSPQFQQAALHPTLARWRVSSSLVLTLWWRG